VLVTLMVSRIFSGGSCVAAGIEPEPASGVSFELSPVLAHAATPVDVRACVWERYSTWRFAMPKPPSSCASVTLYPRDSESDVFVNDPSVTSEPIMVRLTMMDQAGNPIFDSSARVQPHIWAAPNGLTLCYPDAYDAAVVATPAGRLVSQP
jgi:hypothetical protein